MENTLENKERFFAQYWGQEFLTSQKHQHEELRYKIGFNIKLVTESHFLELTPLSQISDEDLNSSLIILGTKSILPTDTKDYIEELRGSFLEGFKNRDFYGTFYPLRVIQLIDYLRSRGYALPFMGMSVDKLVEYGWVKLKEANNEN